MVNLKTDLDDKAHKRREKVNTSKKKTEIEISDSAGAVYSGSIIESVHFQNHFSLAD